MKRYIIAASFIIIISLLSASTPDLITPYLNENFSSLDVANLDLSIMGSDLAEYDVFLAGSEWHGTTASYDLQYALATTLNREAGVKYLLMGIGYATAQTYNAYLETGEKEILDAITSAIKYSNSSNHEHRLSWEKLYQYNQTLPEDQRISVVGIDLEYEVYLAIRYLSTLPGIEGLPFYPMPVRNAASIEEFVNRMRAELDANETKYRTAMGASFSELELILNNLWDTVTAHYADNFYAARERILYDNFLKAYNSLPEGKYFGHWSMEHIYLRETRTPNLSGTETLAMFLNHEDDSPVKDRVLSIASLYLDSEYRFFYGRYYNAGISNDYVSNVQPLQIVANSEFTLFRLTNDNSPFAFRPYTVRSHTGGAATDYYQYIIVIKNSVPGSPNQ